MVSRFIDPSFKAHESLTRVVAELVLQLSTETKLPFDCLELAAMVQREFVALNESLTSASISDHHLERLGQYGSVAYINILVFL